MLNKGNLVKEYTDGETKIKIFDGAYSNLTEKEKDERDYQIGETVLRLLSEIENLEFYEEDFA